MANVRQPGIVVTQVGIDARTAADYQKVFDSNWPSLQIAFESNVTLAPSASTTVSHNLGFVPFVQSWLISGGVSIGRISGLSGNLSGEQTDVSVTFDDKILNIRNGGTKTYTISIKCYNFDITKSADYSLPAAPVVNRPYDDSYGIKVVKSGKSIASHDLRDFILHSRAQSPALLTIKAMDKAYWGQPYGTYYIYNIFYQNPSGYIPWTFAFFKSKGYWYELAPGNQQSGNQFSLTSDLTGFGTQVTNPSTLSLKGPGGILQFTDNANPPTTQAALVVFRDPLVVPTILRYQYG